MFKRTARFCSHSCASEHMWDTKRQRAPKKSPGPHFYDGQWWVHLKSGKRTAGEMVQCHQCGKAMVTGQRSPYRHIYCSRRCLHDKRSSPVGSVRKDTRYILERVDPDDPICAPMMRVNAAGYSTFFVWQQRVVMARALGRPLERHESVHHINGEPTDNRLENLQLRSGPHGMHQAARCADCGSTHIVFEGIAE